MESPVAVFCEIFITKNNSKFSPVTLIKILKISLKLSSPPKWTFLNNYKNKIFGLEGVCSDGKVGKDTKFPYFHKNLEISYKCFLVRTSDVARGGANELLLLNLEKMPKYEKTLESHNFSEYFGICTPWLKNLVTSLGFTKTFKNLNEA